MSDIWSGGRYMDADWAHEAADDAWADDLNEVWAEATPAQRKAIARERGALDIRDKARRNWTPTEQAIYLSLCHAQWLRDERRIGDDEVLF
jgi:hypothetical protein